VRIINDSSTRTINLRALQRVVLVITSGQEIPLTRSFGGAANEQRYQSVDEIDLFINNAQQNTLSITTSRSWLFWTIGGFLEIVDFIFLVVAWSSAGNRRDPPNNFHEN
jgi:hypothetical protein